MSTSIAAHALSGPTLRLARAYAPTTPTTTSFSNAAASRIDRLEAGRVDGGASFTAEEPRSVLDEARQVLRLYALPGNANAAATGVAAGRLLDVRG